MDGLTTVDFIALLVYHYRHRSMQNDWGSAANGEELGVSSVSWAALGGMDEV